MDIQQTAMSVVAILAPFLPKFVGASVEQMGKIAGGGIAQKLWECLKPKIEADKKLEAAILVASQQAESETAKKLLIETMIPFLSVDPTLLKDLTALLALDKLTQEIAVEGSEVRDVTQKSSGSQPSNQTISIRDSKARDINQSS